MGIDKAKKEEIEKANEEKITRDDKLFLEQMQRPIPEPNPEVKDGHEDWWNKGYQPHLSGLNENDVRRKFAYHSGHLPENRDYLMPKEFLDKIKVVRDNDDTVNSSAFSNFLTSNDTGGSANNLRNSVAQTFAGMKDAFKYVPFAPSHNMNEMTMAGITGSERFPEDQRRCWWKLHKFHLCLMAHTNEVNPFWLLPDPNLRFIQDLVTNVNETYHLPECAAERLTANVFCDDSEVNSYYKYQKAVHRNWYFTTKWKDAKAIYKNGLDSMKHMIGYEPNPEVIESKEPVRPREDPPYIKKILLEERRRLEIINSRADKKD